MAVILDGVYICVACILDMRYAAISVGDAATQTKLNESEIYDGPREVCSICDKERR